MSSSVLLTAHASSQVSCFFLFFITHTLTYSFYAAPPPPPHTHTHKNTHIHLTWSFSYPPSLTCSLLCLLIPNLVLFMSLPFTAPFYTLAYLSFFCHPSLAWSVLCYPLPVLFLPPIPCLVLFMLPLTCSFYAWPPYMSFLCSTPLPVTAVWICPFSFHHCPLAAGRCLKINNGRVAGWL